MKRTALLLLSAMLLLGACAARQGIEIRDAWARPSTQGMNSAVYFVIQNHSAETDELVGAASDAAEAVEIHESKMEGDVMTMSRVESIALEPSAKVEFEPGGYHVMLIGLKQDLKTGDEIQIVLQFRNSPDLTVTAAVKDSNGMQGMEDHSP
ncbi:MAG: copper chaperone PCu(A)C [Anaerolineales bacterium]|nr:copper chaperone PCu(A)C [Anaerolineales bacterium]NUQ84093.1 copper chaperone PCu(A)C [Anaerolineales bacterium]